MGATLVVGFFVEIMHKTCSASFFLELLSRLERPCCASPPVLETLRGLLRPVACLNVHRTFALTATPGEFKSAPASFKK